MSSALYSPEPSPEPIDEPETPVVDMLSPVPRPTVHGHLNQLELPQDVNSQSNIQAPLTPNDEIIL